MSFKLNKINLIFLLFISTIMINYLYVNNIFYIVYLLEFILCYTMFFSDNTNYKIIYDKKILLFFIIYLVESSVVSIIFSIYNNSFKNSIKLLVSYSILFIIITFIKVYSYKCIYKFYKVLQYFLNFLMLINIYEIITQKSVFSKYLLNGQTTWQINNMNLNFRTYSIFIHPIIYSMFLVILFWLNIFLQRKNKIIDWISTILLLINLYYTKARSGWLALAISLTLYLFIKILYRIQILTIAKKIIRVKKLIFTISALIFGVFIVIFFANSLHNIYLTIYYRFITVTNDSYYDYSRLQRLGTLQIMNNYMLHNGIINFLFGNGFGSATIFMQTHYVIALGFLTTDNQFASMFYEFGFIGLVSYFIILILAVLKLFKDNKNALSNLNIYILISISITIFFYEGFGLLDILFVTMLCLLTTCIQSINKIESGLQGPTSS